MLQWAQFSLAIVGMLVLPLGIWLVNLHTRVVKLETKEDRMADLAKRIERLDQKIDDLTNFLLRELGRDIPTHG